VAFFILPFPPCLLPPFFSMHSFFSGTLALTASFWSDLMARLLLFILFRNDRSRHVCPSLLGNLFSFFAACRHFQVILFRFSALVFLLSSIQVMDPLFGRDLLDRFFQIPTLRMWLSPSRETERLAPATGL